MTFWTAASEPSGRPPGRPSFALSAPFSVSERTSKPRLPVHDALDTRDRLDHGGLEVALDRATGGGQGDGDVDDAGVLDGDRPDHLELDDVAPQLGVDDGLERFADLGLGRHGSKDRDGGVKDRRGAQYCDAPTAEGGEVLLCQARYEAWQPYPESWPLLLAGRGSPFPYASVFWTLVMTRSPAATPAWTASSTRPTPSRPGAVTTLLRRLTSRPTALVSRSKRRSLRRIRRSARVVAPCGSPSSHALEAAQGDPATGRERLGDVGGDAGDAVTRLQHGADVDEPGALGDVAALLRRRLGGGRVGLGGLAGLVLRSGARATTGGLRRRLGGRRARGAARAGGRLTSRTGLLGGGGASGGGH